MHFQGDIDGDIDWSPISDIKRERALIISQGERATEREKLLRPLLLFWIGKVRPQFFFLHFTEDRSYNSICRQSNNARNRRSKIKSRHLIFSMRRGELAARKIKIGIPSVDPRISPGNFPNRIFGDARCQSRDSWPPQTLPKQATLFLLPLFFCAQTENESIWGKEGERGILGQILFHADCLTIILIRVQRKKVFTGNVKDRARLRCFPPRWCG